MRYRFIFILPFLLLFTVILNGQSSTDIPVTITKSEPLELSKDESIVWMDEMVDGHLFSVQIKAIGNKLKRKFIARNSNGQILSESPTVTIKGSSIKMELAKSDITNGYPSINGKRLIPSYTLKKSPNKFSQKVVWFDEASFKMEDEEKELINLPVAHRQFISSGLIVSNDKSKILSYCVHRQKAQGQHILLHLAVFDENLNPIWDKNLEFPESHLQLEIGSFLINNSGNVFFRSQKLDPGQMLTAFLFDPYYAWDAPNQKAICFVSEKDEGYSEYKIKYDKELFLTKNLFLKIDKDENLLTVCRYQPRKKDDGEYGGIYIQVFDGYNSSVISESEIPFTEQNLFFEEKEQKIGLNIVLKDIIFKPDGGFILPLEVLSFRSNYSSNPSFSMSPSGALRTRNSSSSTKTYSYDDFFIFDLKSNHSINWSARISKKGPSNGNYPLKQNHFETVIANDKTYLFFKDYSRQPLQLNKKTGKAIVVVINQDGQKEQYDLTEGTSSLSQYRNTSSSSFIKIPFVKLNKAEIIFINKEKRETYFHKFSLK